MKCPKCGYLGFEAVDRCRNCGYDFSLSAGPSAPELPMRPAGGDGGGPLEDLSLGPPVIRESADTMRGASASAERSGSELPLFGGGADDAPLITRASAPRPPLSVRRATPEVPRLRTDHRPSLLDHTPDVDEPPVLWRPPPAPAVPKPAPNSHAASTAVPPSEELESAGLVARAVAGLLDLAVLLTVDLVVVYFTLKITGLSFEELDRLPTVPLVIYLLMQNMAYFAAFTAGGQTLGKMVTGIQVVAEGTDRPPTLSHALLRTTWWILLAVPAGLGLASVLLDGEKRGLHDRFAGTRVVRALA